MESRFKIKDVGLHKRGHIGAATQLKRDFQLHFLRLKGLQPTNTLLEAGCGTLRGGVPIIDYLNKDNYVGVEMRESAYNCAMMELDYYPKLKDKNPTVVNSNFASFSTERKFDFIWSFAVLFHIPSEVIPAWFSQIERYLADDGVYYANIAQETHTQWGKDIIGKGEYPMLYRSLSFYQDIANANGLNVEDIGANSEYGHVGHSPDEDEQRMLKIQRK